MSATRTNGSPAEGKRRNLGSDPQGGGGVDREAVLHRRRKKAMVSLLSEFERIERHVAPGHTQEIDHFKRSCRDKLNGLTFLACELLKLKPGEGLNEAAVDLAEQLEYDTKP